MSPVGQPAQKGRKKSHPQKALPLYRQPNTVRGGPEKKNHDVGTTIAMTAGALTFVAPGAATLLNGISEGATSTSRVGRKISMVKLTVYWSAYLASTSIGGSPIRVMIIYDKQANTAAPAVLTWLNTNDFHSQNQLYNSDRFITVGSWITDTISVGGNYCVAGKWSRSIDLETIYNDGNAGLISDIQTGSLYLTTAQNGQIGTAGPSFQFISRLRFIDF